MQKKMITQLCCALQRNQVFSWLSRVALMIVLLALPSAINADNIYLETAQLTGGNYNGANSLKFTQQNGSEQYTYTINSIPSGGLNFRIYSQNDNVQYCPYVDEYEITASNSTSSAYGMTNDTKATGTRADYTFVIPASKAGTPYTIHFYKDNGKWKLYVQSSTAPEPEVDEFYVVLEDATTGKVLNRFHMDAVRNRVWLNKQKQGDGNANNNYHSVNFKDDDINGTATNLRWYIENVNKTTFYYPTSTTNLGTYTEAFGPNNHYGSLDNQQRSSAPSSSYYTFTRGVGKSYTVMLSRYNNAQKVTFVRNTSIVENKVNSFHNDGTGYYLVGNFQNANSGFVPIEPSNSTYRKVMTRFRYRNGLAFSDAQWKQQFGDNAKADSVVWRAHVDQPTGGWDNLYLVIGAKNLVDYWSNITDPWNYMIRPQIATQKLDNFNVVKYFYDGKEQSVPADVDSRSYQGGLYQGDYTFKDVANQAINPNLDELASALGYENKNKIPSYEFSFNATTSTYRLVFNKPLESSTITLRDYGDVEYNGEERTIDGRNGLRFFTRFYSTDSYTVPNGVGMFTISKIRNDDVEGVTNVVLTPVSPITFTLNGEEKSVMPSHLPMILVYACDDDKTVFSDVSGATFTPRDKTSSTFNELSFKVDRIPTAQYRTTGTPASPYFVGANESQSLSQSFNYNENGETKTGYNYHLGFYRHSRWAGGTDNHHFDLGFWVSNGKKQTYNNDAWLSLPADVILKNAIGTSFDNVLYSSAAKGGVPALFFDWSVANGITDINAEANTKVNADDAWYTLQGVRIAEPTQQGVYIHNGKKVVKK